MILLGNLTVSEGKKLGAKNRAYLILMMIPFLLIPGRLIGPLSNNQILAYIFTAALSIFLVIDTLLRFREFIKENKANDIGFFKAFLK
jgi:hypothetical protein